MQRQFNFVTVPIHHSYNTSTRKEIGEVVNNFFTHLKNQSQNLNNKIQKISIDYEAMSINIKTTWSNYVLLKKIEMYLIHFSAGREECISPFSDRAFTQLSPTEWTTMRQIFRLIADQLITNKKKYEFLQIDDFNQRLEVKAEEINDRLNKIPQKYQFLIQTAFNQFLRFALQKSYITFNFFERFVTQSMKLFSSLQFDLSYEDSGFSILSYTLYHFYCAASASKQASELKRIISFIFTSTNSTSIVERRNFYGESLLDICETFADHKYYDHRIVSLLVIQTSLNFALKRIKSRSLLCY